MALIFVFSDKRFTDERESQWLKKETRKAPRHYEQTEESAWQSATPTLILGVKIALPKGTFGAALSGGSLESSSALVAVTSVIYTRILRSSTQ